MENKTYEKNNNNFIKAAADAPEYKSLTIEEITTILSKLDDILFLYARHPKIEELQEKNQKKYSLDEIMELLKPFNEEIIKFNMVTVSNDSFSNNNNHRTTLAHCLENPVIIKNPKICGLLFDFLFDDHIKISDISKLHLLASFMEKIDAHQFVAIFENNFSLYSFYALQQNNPNILQKLIEILTYPNGLDLLEEWDTDNEDLENSVADFDENDFIHLQKLLEYEQTQEETQNESQQNTYRRNSADIIKSLPIPENVLTEKSSDEDTISNTSGECNDDGSINSESENIIIDHKANGDHCETNFQPNPFSA